MKLQGHDLLSGGGTAEAAHTSAISSCLLHYTGVTSWAGQWTEGVDSAEKQSIKREWHQRKVIFVEISTFPKH